MKSMVKALILGAPLLFSVSTVAHATLIDLEIQFDTEINLDLGDNPFSLRYTEAGSGLLDIVYDSGPALAPNENVQQGFVLLDGTLNVTRTGDTAARRVRARYQLPFARRALGRIGVRASDLRLMRFDGRTSTWLRARMLLRNTDARQDARFLFGRRATFQLADYGVDTQLGLVWGVMDVTGRYAIGARQVPAPATLALLAAGIVGLWFGVRPRRARA